MDSTMQGKNNLSLATPIYAPDMADFMQDSYVIVDIRDESDYNYAHIRDSKHFSNAQEVYAFSQKNAQTKILLVCYSGHTAANLGTALVQNGCQNIYFFDDYFAHFELLGLLNTQDSKDSTPKQKGLDL